MAGPSSWPHGSGKEKAPLLPKSRDGDKSYPAVVVVEEEIGTFSSSTTSEQYSTFEGSASPPSCSDDGQNGPPEKSEYSRADSDPSTVTTKAEIWAYCLYYVGNSGLTLAMFAPVAMQNLLSLAAGDKGLLLFFGGYRTVNSIALLANAMAFCVQTAIFVVIGSFADYGNWRSSILTVQTFLGIGIGFAWLGLHEPEKWRSGVLVYIIGLVAYQTCLAYFYAAFPTLARNTPKLRKKAEELDRGIITLDEYQAADSRARNRISNMSLWVAGGGGVFVIGAMLEILTRVKATSSASANSWGLSLILAFGSGVWLILALPWFFLEKRRPGQPIPPGMNIVAAGARQIYKAATQIRKLRYSLAYLIGYGILAESLSTSVTVISTLQNAVVSYNATVLAQLVVVQFLSSTCGLFLWIRFQKFFALSPKTMLCGVISCIVLINLWGALGTWTTKVGFHQEWEFWAFAVWFGFFITPFYSYSQTMISEVTPRGKDFLFFSLFNIAGKASAFIGPMISSAIIDLVPNHDPNTPFYFLTAMTVTGLLLVIFCVDLAGSRTEQRRYLEEEEMEKLAFLVEESLRTS